MNVGKHVPRLESSRRHDQLGYSDPADWPVWIGVLGNFRVLKTGELMAMPNGGKMETLLSILALRYYQRVPRDALLTHLWPTQSPDLASKSLYTLVYTLHKQLGDALNGEALVSHAAGFYWLNREAGVGVDFACFDELVKRGEAFLGANDLSAAITCFKGAVNLYRGDLYAEPDAYAAVERERVRACYLSLLAQLADYHYDQREYTACLTYAQQLLTIEPCREDAHRLLMRCYVQRGERAQALRQYHLCAAVLRMEFDATPEQATTALYEQVRLAPDSI